MAITDAYGNPVEPGTPVITLYGSDNKPLPSRKRIFVDSSLVLSDDPASDATRLSAASQTPADGSITTAKLAAGAVTNPKLANSGGAAGRLGIPVLIDSAALAAATGYTSPAFTAEAYLKIWMDIDGLETSASFDPVLVLGGLTGSGESKVIYISGTTITAFSNDSTMFTAILDSGGGNIDVHGYIEVCPLNTGRPRGWFSRWSSTGTIRRSYGAGMTADTSHGITTIGWSGSTSFTGSVNVWGIPA